MRLFICWSGKRGHRLANATRDLVRGVFGLGPDDVFVSSETEKGVNWFDEILQNLEMADAGILCLTPEGMRSPWIHFEAGALAMGMAMGRHRAGGAHAHGEQAARSQSRLYTLLHQVAPGELEGPLASYQSTTTEQGDVARLMIALAELGGRTCSREALGAHWSPFEEALRGLQLSVPEVVPGFETLFRRKTFHEPVHQCTSQKWVDRYLGARDTREKLDSCEDVVRKACAPSAQELFGQLKAELDGYAMAMEALLIQPRRFEMRRTGELDLEPGTRRSCERRRLKVNTLACRLRDAGDAPLSDHAVIYATAQTYAERRRIIHVLESRVRQQCERARSGADGEPSARLPRGRALAEYAASTWELDRILRYLVLKYFPDDRGGAAGQCAGDAARDALLELDAVRTSAGSMLPLYHALCALQAALRGHPADDEARTVVREVGDYLDEGGRRRDRGGLVARSLRSISSRLAAAAAPAPSGDADTVRVVAV